MKHRKADIKNSRFPPSLFFVYLFVLLLMSGIHTPVLVLTDTLNLNDFVQTLLPIIYWSAVAMGLTLFTRWRIRKRYDISMKQLAEATEKVAHGDFSVFVPPMHMISLKTGLPRCMIMDFNKMVEELSSIETLKTDFVSNVSHEIKTPLSIIKNYTTMLKKSDLPIETREEYMDTVIQAADKMACVGQQYPKAQQAGKSTD